MKILIKTIIILVLLCTCIIEGRGQEVNYNALAEGDHYLYVGKLRKSSIHTFDKLKIEVFGGYYWLDSGTTTYSISTRDACSIFIDKNGGRSVNFSLEVYENGDSFDFALKVGQYAMLNIKATYPICQYTEFNTVIQPTPIAIKKYDITNKKNVTNLFTQTITTATDLSGNLGIGTLTPQAKLDVRGKIIADEVEVKVNKGADFVFNADYNLRPLSEVETFVKENKHLPEVPSEKEMLENGLNVNDMQIKLLQKIEELTLYVIDLKKEIEILKTK